MKFTGSDCTDGIPLRVTWSCVLLNMRVFNPFGPNRREPERCFSFITISMKGRELNQIEDSLP